MNQRNVQSKASRGVMNYAVVRARDLIVAVLCVLPPLYLSNRLSTLHTVTDSKWLVVIFLSGCEIFLIVLAAAMSPNKFRRAREPLNLALVAGATMFAVTHLFSALHCREPGFAFRAMVPSLSLVVLFGAIVWQPASPYQICKFTILILATGALIGTCAIAQHFGFDPLARLVRYREADRYRTGAFVTLANPEYLGGYLTVPALISLGLILASRSWQRRCAALAAAMLTAIPAFLSGSRGPFLGMAAGVIFLSVGSMVTAPRSSRQRRLGGLAAGSALVTLVAIVLFAGSPIKPIGLMRARLADLADPHSDSVRKRIVFNLVGLKMVAGHPVLGVGPGMFGVEFYPTFLSLAHSSRNATMDVVARDLHGIVAEHAHNDWLEIWAETGTVGFAAWFWIVALWTVGVFRGLARRSGQPGDRLFALALASAAIALLVNAFFNFPLHEPVRATLFWLTLAWSHSLASSNDGHLGES